MISPLSISAVNHYTDSILLYNNLEECGVQSGAGQPSHPYVGRRCHPHALSKSFISSQYHLQVLHLSKFPTITKINNAHATDLFPVNVNNCILMSG